MAFNPVLQSGIQPVQTAVQPDSTSFLAGALGATLDFGSAVLGQQMRQDAVTAKKQEAEQKALLDEKVSGAAIELTDIFSNASSRNATRVQQRLSEAVARMRNNGFSEADIAASIEKANKVSGTSFSAAVKLERNEADEQLKQQQQLMKDYMAVAAYVPVEYLNDDGSLPTEGAAMQAAYFAALSRKGSVEARTSQANMVSAEANAQQNAMQIRSRVLSEALAANLTSAMTQQFNQYDLNTSEGTQKAVQAIADLKLSLPAIINSNQELTRADKDSLLSGMNATLTALSDNVTGETMRDLSAKQRGAYLEKSLNFFLDGNDELFQMYIMSAAGVQVQPVSVLDLDVSGFKALYGSNPNSPALSDPLKKRGSNVPPEQALSAARDAWVQLHTPTRPVESDMLAQQYVQKWSTVFAAPTRMDKENLFSPDGMYLKSLRQFRDKKIVDNLGVMVVGNQEFQDSFAQATSNAIGTYVPLAMNMEFNGTKIKDVVKLSLAGGPAQIQIVSPAEFLGSLPVHMRAAKDSQRAYYDRAASATQKLNSILKQQYEAAVQIDRVSGSKLAEQIRNAQLDTIRQFMQVGTE